MANATHDAGLPIPLVADMIHRPGVPRHMMRVKPVGHRITITVGERVIAHSDRALRVVEIGHDLYDPVVYVPTADVSVSFEANEHTTHCPLKGDTTYYDLPAGEHRDGQTNIAWEYSRPLACAEVLRGHVAFDTQRVSITETPRDAVPA